jgi:hypothetical protein
MSQSQGTVNGKANTDTLVKVGELQIDRAQLDKTVQSALKKEEGNLAYLLQLMDDSFWSQIWLDPRVTDKDGKPFATWGKWYADRVKAYPIAKSAITPTFVKSMLVNASVREVVAACGMSRGYVHELNLERQGKQTTKQKRAASKQGGSKTADQAKQEVADQANQTADALAKGSDLSRIVTALVPLVTKAIDLIAEMDSDTLATFQRAMVAGNTAADAMVAVNAQGAKVAATKASQAADKVPA